MRDLGELHFSDFMKTNPSFALGDVFIFRSKGLDYDGYTVAVYEQPDPQGPADICRKGIFWEKNLALAFADTLIWNR